MRAQKQITHLSLFVFAEQFPLQEQALVHLNPLLMHSQHPFLQFPLEQPHLDLRHGLMACVRTWCAS